MRLLPGWLLNNLSYRVDKDIQDTLYKNSEFLKSRWGLVEFNIVQWSTHYVKYVLLTLLFFVLLIVSLKLWQPILQQQVLPYIPHWKELFIWQGLFLAGQLTVIGVVYPLVVGLVGVLFQNKSAKKILFPVYQKYSGFMFAGLSGLSLSIFIVVASLSRASIDDSTYFAFCIASAIWLICNLALTAWFFVQTFNILNDEFRNRLLMRYSIHEACEQDIRDRLQYSLMEYPSLHGFLSSFNEDVLKIESYLIGNSKELIMNVDRDFSIVDVRYRIISIAILVQTIILKFRNKNGGKISIKSMSKKSKGREMIIANYDGFEMSPFVKFLIILAHKYRKTHSSIDIGFSTVLAALVGPIDDALRDSDTRSYSKSVNNLVDGHTEIAQSLAFKNDTGKLDNWLLLASRGMFGQNYFGELLREYFRLARQAVEKISENSSYYEDLLYLHKQIYARRDQLVDQEKRSLIQGSYYLWYLLVEWRSYTGNSSSLKVNDKYEDILYGFVGAWESWPNYIEPKSERFKGLVQAYPSYIYHLEFTSMTAITALRFDNYEAAGWGVDMLNSWFSNFSNSDFNHSEYSWRSNLVNHRLLELDSEHSSWKNILKNQAFKEQDAFDLAFKNAHIDIRVLTACYMLIKPNSKDKEALARYVKALLAGERIHSTGAVGTRSYNVTNAGDLLGLYFRHRDYRGRGDNSYGGWLASVLESFSRLHDQKRVSGRVYSGWGSMDPYSMSKAYVEIALSMSSNRWNLSTNWKESVLSSVFRNQDRQSIISDLKEWIRLSNEDREFILIENDDLPQLKENFQESLNKIIEQLKSKAEEEIDGAEIDKERLKSFGVACSEYLINKEYSFPLNLIGNVELNPENPVKGEFQVGVAKYKKERVAKGIECQRASNEYEWMSDYVKEDIKTNIIREMLRYPETGQHNYSDEASILDGVLELSGGLACPVLVTGDSDLRRILHRASYEQEYIDGYDIARKDGYGNRYICHIGRCEVYSLRFSDVDFSLLTSKEIFERVSFEPVDEAQYIDVDFELDDGSRAEGTLELSYKMDVDLAPDVECIRLNLAVKDDNGT